MTLNEHLMQYLEQRGTTVAQIRAQWTPEQIRQFCIRQYAYANDILFPLLQKLSKPDMQRRDFGFLFQQKLSGLFTPAYIFGLQGHSAIDDPQAPDYDPVKYSGRLVLIASYARLTKMSESRAEAVLERKDAFTEYDRLFETSYKATITDRLRHAS